MIRFIIFFLAGVFALSPAQVAAQDRDSMVGSWVCVSGCGCQPASPQGFASIRKEADDGIARNECGSETPVSFASGVIRAEAWNLAGSVSGDLGRIDWQNGTVWLRQSSDVSEIERRIAYWEGQTFYCADRASSSRPRKTVMEGPRSATTETPSCSTPFFAGWATSVDV